MVAPTTVSATTEHKGQYHVRLIEKYYAVPTSNDSIRTQFNELVFKLLPEPLDILFLSLI